MSVSKEREESFHWGTFLSSPNCLEEPQGPSSRIPSPSWPHTFSMH